MAGDGAAEPGDPLSRNPDLSGPAGGAAARGVGVDPARSAQMRLVRGKDTGPEMVVRRLAHGLGYRFRLHRRDLPGAPDLVFAGRRGIVFVHGCFWHRHGDPGCWRARLPKSRPEFWVPKLSANAARDASVEAALRADGWEVLVIWECETTPTRRRALAERLDGFLGGKIRPQES
ncbi:very short patch repair endonuclease [uncultured Amaricoccus sp.]|uniref:very short patch repair endonuclease n=1 Tax=uncultured Amaricoccus sp. TaxID=339341 RepID=UPI00345A43CB